MKKICSKKCCFLCSLLLVLLLSLTACSDDFEKLTEGDCPGVVAFDIPEEFALLGSEFMDDFYIELDLRNSTTKQLYEITLDKDNDFRQELSLNPGTYEVRGTWVYSGLYYVYYADVDVSAESMTFASDQHAVLTLSLSDIEAFIQHRMEAQPVPEILQADKFSGMIQINRRVIPIQDILQELTLENNLGEDTLDPSMSVTLYDNEKRVRVTLQNTTESPLHWSSCTVTSIFVWGDTVLFPKGVSAGLETDKVCHQTTGIYGEPTEFTGTILFGWSFDETYAVYFDPETGNRITLNTGSSIHSITYELGINE